MNTIENKHRKYLLGKSEQMFVQCTRYSFIMDLTSCDKSCCYTMNSAAVLWFIKGIVHQKMKFIIIYLLSCCSKTFIVFIFFYLPVEHKGSYLHKNVHAALFYIMKVNDENAIFFKQYIQDHTFKWQKQKDTVWFLKTSSKLYGLLYGNF